DRQPGARLDPGGGARAVPAAGRGRPAAAAGGRRQPGRRGLRPRGAAGAARPPRRAARAPAPVAAVPRRRRRGGGGAPARRGPAGGPAPVLRRHGRAPARRAPGGDARGGDDHRRPAGGRAPGHRGADPAGRVARRAAGQCPRAGAARRGLVHARGRRALRGRSAGGAAGGAVRGAGGAGGGGGGGRAPGAARARRAMTARDDVLVVGGGHNGLVCAAYLAAAGLKVRVLERRGIVGGAAVTEEFHPGFRNSVASYTVSLLHPQVIAELRLAEHGLRVVERPFSNFLPLPDGRAFRLGGPDAHAQVAAWSPRDAERLPAYFAMLDRVVAVLRELMAMTPPNVGEGFVLADWLASAAVARRLGRLDLRGRRDLLDLFTKSAGELLDHWFESEPLKAALGWD